MHFGAGAAWMEHYAVLQAPSSPLSALTLSLPAPFRVDPSFPARIQRGESHPQGQLWAWAGQALVPTFPHGT